MSFISRKVEKHCKAIESILNRTLNTDEVCLLSNVLSESQPDIQECTNELIEQKIFTIFIDKQSDVANKSIAVVNALLSCYNDNYRPLSCVLSFQLPEKECNKDELKNCLNVISQAISELSIPVISSAVYFSSELKLGILTLSMLCEKKPLQAPELNLYSMFYLSPVNEVTDDFFQSKLLKEAMNELLDTRVCRCFYNAKSNSQLIASYANKCKVSGKLDFYRIIGKSNTAGEFLNASAKNNCLVKIPEAFQNEFRTICKKWHQKAEFLGNTFDGESLNVLISDNCQLLLNIEKLDSIQRIIKESCHVYNVLIDSEFKNKTKLSFRMKWSKEMAGKLMYRPNLVSKKYIKEQFNRFSGNSNLSVNFHTDAPLMRTPDNKLFTLTLSSKCIFSEELLLHNLKLQFYELVRRTIATGAQPYLLSVLLVINEDLVYSLDVDSLKTAIANLANEFGLKCVISSVYEGNWQFPASIIPVLSLSGEIKKYQHVKEYHFKEKGDVIFLIGKTYETLSDEYLQEAHQIRDAGIVDQDFDLERKVNQFVVQHIDYQDVKTIHRVSMHGLYHSLIEACVPGRFGFDITTDAEFRPDVFLCSGMGGRFLVTVLKSREDVFIDALVENDIPFTTLGHVTKEELRIDDISYGFIKDVRKKYLKELENFLK